MLYEVGQCIIYGSDGVCKVESIGPLEMRGVRKNVDYYTLVPVYQTGKIYAPIDSETYTRPVMSRQEAEQLIAEIPDIPVEVYENSNPRLLGEHYQAYLKSHDCRDLIRVIRAIYAKNQTVTARGRRLGQVDERSFKQAVDMLHSELAVALGIGKDEVEGYITEALEK